jgi:hypothetical protein
MSNVSAISDTTDNIADSVEELLRTTYAGAKRRIAALEQELVTIQEAGTKRKS